jgi:hypothetical protein
VTDIPKHDPRVMKIKDFIDAEYTVDRVSPISDDEMTGWMKELFGNELPSLR